MSPSQAHRTRRSSAAARKLISHAGRKTQTLISRRAFCEATAASALSAFGAASRAFSESDRQTVKKWFADYLNWMTCSPHGIEEREAKNSHGTCWVMQVAEFARFAEEPRWGDFCRTRFKTVLLPNQMARNGSFPLELRRTKPYGYSLFNLDAMAAVCQILSTTQENLFRYDLPDGRGMGIAMGYMFPYIAHKHTWPFPPDVMYFGQWPVRQPSLLFTGLALSRPEYLALWRTRNPDPAVEEVICN